MNTNVLNPENYNTQYYDKQIEAQSRVKIVGRIAAAVAGVAAIGTFVLGAAGLSTGAATGLAALAITPVLGAVPVFALIGAAFTLLTVAIIAASLFLLKHHKDEATQLEELGYINWYQCPTMYECLSNPNTREIVEYVLCTEDADYDQEDAALIIGQLSGEEQELQGQIAQIVTTLQELAYHQTDLSEERQERIAAFTVYLESL